MLSSVRDGQKPGDMDPPFPPEPTKLLSTTYGTFDVNSAARIRIPGPAGSARPVTFWRSKKFIILCVFSFIGLFGLLSSIRDFLNLIWYLIVCGSTLSPRGPPKTWKDYTNQTFAVGFDLTAGYGTAAVMFGNGTVVDVGRAEGNNEYNEVLARLSLEDSAHLSPPYYDCTAQTNDLGRQWRRYFRRCLGRPASSDVAALATVISDLKHQANSFLHASALGQLEIAFITAPYLPALYAEDLADAAEYAKVQMLTLPGSIFKSPGSDGAWVVSEINTAFAGNGLGLNHLDDGPYTKTLSSENYQIENEKDDFELRDEKTSDEGKMSTLTPWPWNTTALSILFTRTALTAHVLLLPSATSFTTGYSISNFSLGLSSQYIPLYQTSIEESTYWHEIRQAIRTVLKSGSNFHHEVSRVIIYGESALDGVLNKIVKEEVQRNQDSDEEEKEPPVFYSKDPVYAAARGAAVLANWCPKLKDYYSCFPDLRPRKRNWF